MILTNYVFVKIIKGNKIEMFPGDEDWQSYAFGVIVNLIKKSFSKVTEFFFIEIICHSTSLISSWVILNNVQTMVFMYSISTRLYSGILNII